MTNPGESHHPDDFISLTVDIESCPIAELPLTEIFDIVSSTIKDDYLAVFCEYITQQLEDTSWLDDQSLTPLFNAGFATFQRKENGDLVSLRKPALQRLINQSLRTRNDNVLPMSIPIFVRFMISDTAMPNRHGTTHVP
jgi:hypothetical protein